MKLLTDDHWAVLMEQMDWLKDRIKELERQNAGLLDRLLIERGQVPLDLGLHTEMKEHEKAEQDLTQILLAEEIGEEPKDGE